MEPYNPNLPFISIANDGKTLLDRMVEAGIPFTRALQYFRNNPEGSALETLKLAAEDVIPFYGNYRNGGDISDYAKEAALMFTPVKGGPKRTVRTRKGEPVKKDLIDWTDATWDKWEKVYGDAATHKYNDQFYNARQLEKSRGNVSDQIRSLEREIAEVRTERNLPEDQKGISGTEWYDNKIAELENELAVEQSKLANYDNEINSAAIDQLGQTERRRWAEIMRNDMNKGDYNSPSGYLLNKLEQEYGPERGKKYFNDIIDNYSNDPRRERYLLWGQRYLKDKGEL